MGSNEELLFLLLLLLQRLFYRQPSLTYSLLVVASETGAISDSPSQDQGHNELE